MISLRDYQLEAIDSIRHGVVRGVKRQLISLPCGTGKTVIFCNVAKGGEAKGNTPLILGHRDELIQQTQDKLTTVAPELANRIGIVKAYQDEFRAGVVIASVQSLHRERRKKILRQLGPQPYPIIVVDEAHHTQADTYQAILEDFGAFEPGGPLVLGFTATPQRADSRDLGDTYEEIVYHRDTLSMIQRGYLCPVTGIQLRLHEFRTEELRVRAGDYVDKQSGDLLEAAEAPVHLARAWKAHASDRKTIVFTPTIHLAGEMARRFREIAGVPAEMVSGETPLDQRRDLLERFRRGEVRVIANAQVLTEGFDDPSVECICIARPTKSQTLYVQMAGRGLRIHPGKQDCLLIDVVGVTERFDLCTAPKMFGLDQASDEDDDDETDPDATTTAAFDISGAATTVQQAYEKQRREGRIVATQVELFSRQDLNWQMASAGIWALSLKDENVICAVEPDGWSVTVHGPNGPRELRRGLDLGYAMGTAEQYARQAPAFAQLLVSKAAGWRALAASDGQLEALRKWRVPIPAGLTRGEASDILTMKIALKQRQEAQR